MRYINNIKICEHPDVYAPCDDTYLLIENIRIAPNEEVLEIGTGTGIIGIHCALARANYAHLKVRAFPNLGDIFIPPLKGRALPPKFVKVTATDINPHAIKCAKENASLNNVKMKIIKSNLFKNVQGTFDVIIFNPPYLPTAKEDRCGGWIDKALDGGKKGDKLIMRFLRIFKKHLKPGGRAYLLLSSLSNMEEIEGYLIKNKIPHKKIAKKKLDFETLFVFEIKVS